MTIGFSVAGRVIDYFGSKSISSNSTAIFELIKNARDANSTRVDIDFTGTDKKNGSIQISDNGDGMNLDDIMNKWMVIGTNDRLINKTFAGGKQVSGEMGIGRIACHKLGNILEMKTVKKNRKKTLKMRFDWSKFEKPGINIEDVKFDDPIEYQVKNPEHGVTLEIYELKSKWPSKEITNLKQEISIMLAEDSETSFSVYVNGENAGKEWAKTRNKILAAAPFKLKAKFDGDNLDIKISNHWGKGKDHLEKQDIHGYYEDYETGPFELEIWHYPRAAAKVKTDFKEIYYENYIGREKLDVFLKTNYNLMLYRDGVWFKPYGLEEDWLDLDKQKVQDSDKIGKTEFYGIIHLSKKKNPNIQQASHRETILKNTAFEKLQKILNDEIMQSLKKYKKEWTKKEKEDKQKDRGNMTPAEGSKNAKKMIKQEIKYLPQKNKARVNQLLDGLIDTTEEQVEEAEKQVRDLGELRGWENNIASLGLAASNMARKVTESLENNMAIAQEAGGIMENADRTKPLPSEIWKRSEVMLTSLSENQAKMKHFMKFLDVMSKHISFANKRNFRPHQVSVWDTWESVINGFDSVREEIGIDVDTLGNDVNVSINQIDLDAILTQLYLNSIESLRHVRSSKKRITVKFDHVGETLFLTFRDNGRGVGKTMVEKIWDAFELGHNIDNTDYHGHGLGLHFIKQIIEKNYPDSPPPTAKNLEPGLEISIAFAGVKKVMV